MDLSASGINGTLPATLAATLSTLRDLNLGLNARLSGPLPPEWSAMRFLTRLVLKGIQPGAGEMRRGNGRCQDE